MSRIPFTKMHGCGNDYIYVDATRYDIDTPSAVAVRWSNRHTGIGSDGLVLIGRPADPRADFSMRIFNADGSEAMMCGNAARCIGKYVYERGLTANTSLLLETRSGLKTLRLLVTDGRVETVTVDMGVPAFEDAGFYDKAAAGDLPDGVFVTMGNPHYVVFTEDVDRIVQAGKCLERHPAFPERCNIEFAHVGIDGIRTRVWERGSGITMACGTGACATAVAAVRRQLASRQTAVVMDGGTLHVEWRPADSHVLLTGPAAIVFDGEADIN